MSVVPGKLEAVSNFHTDGISTERAVVFVFNPAKLGVAATAKWEQPAASGNKKAGPPQFKGADPVTMDLELVLDGWEERNKSRDILMDVNTLISWTRPTSSTRNSKKPSPPIVRLYWGTPWFECYVTNVKVSYTMFDKDGKPVRATVTVNLKELGTTPPKQNPTSGSLAGHQSHMVVQGDSLPLLAHQYYEKAEYWRGVAIANNIDDPLRVLPGTRILLPPLEDVAALSA
jgi:nucleoid-associated protein YgaU